MFQRLVSIWKQLRVKASGETRMAGVFTPPFAPSGWWRDNSAEQLRQYQSWVYVAVNAIAQEVARQRPHLYRNLGQAEHEQSPLMVNHPLYQLLDSPNPWTTPWELWYLTTVSLELTGNCYWYVAPIRRSDNGMSLPGEIWVVPTPWVRVIPDARCFIKGYEVEAPGVPRTMFMPEEIIHLKYPNPMDVHYGLSPLQANALTIDANTELLKSRHHTFQAGPRPGVVLQTEQTLNDQTLNRLEAKLETKFAGRQHWHRPMVLEQGLKASPWTLTPAEMDFLNSSKMSRDEILAMFRVPAPITGLMDNVGLGGEIWTGARIMFCEGTVQPKLDLIGQALTRDLARRFGSDIAVSFPDCSPRLLEQRRKDDEVDAKLGLRTYNEIRRGRGLPALADKRFDEPMLPRDLRFHEPKA